MPFRAFTWRPARGARGAARLVSADTVLVAQAAPLEDRADEDLERLTRGAPLEPRPTALTLGLRDVEDDALVPRGPDATLEIDAPPDRPRLCASDRRALLRVGARAWLFSIDGASPELLRELVDPCPRGAAELVGDFIVTWSAGVLSSADLSVPAPTVRTYEPRCGEGVAVASLGPSRVAVCHLSRHDGVVRTTTLLPSARGWVPTERVRLEGVDAVESLLRVEGWSERIFPVVSDRGERHVLGCRPDGSMRVGRAFDGDLDDLRLWDLGWPGGVVLVELPGPPPVVALLSLLDGRAGPRGLREIDAPGADVVSVFVTDDTLYLISEDTGAFHGVAVDREDAEALMGGAPAPRPDVETAAPVDHDTSALFEAAERQDARDGGDPEPPAEPLPPPSTPAPPPPDPPVFALPDPAGGGSAPDAVVRSAPAIGEGHALALLPGRGLLAVGVRGPVRFWRPGLEEWIASDTPGLSGDVSGIATSSDGRRFALYTDGAVRVYQVGEVLCAGRPIPVPAPSRVHLSDDGVLYVEANAPGFFRELIAFDGHCGVELGRATLRLEGDVPPAECSWGAGPRGLGVTTCTYERERSDGGPVQYFERVELGWWHPCDGLTVGVSARRRNDEDSFSSRPGGRVCYCQHGLERWWFDHDGCWSATLEAPQSPYRTLPTWAVSGGRRTFARWSDEVWMRERGPESAWVLLLDRARFWDVDPAGRTLAFDDGRPGLLFIDGEPASPDAPYGDGAAWPTDTIEPFPSGSTHDSQAEGVLALAGYHAGARGLPPDQRVDVLTRLFRDPLPRHFAAIVGDGEVRRWGEAGSAERLKCLATRLATQVRLGSEPAAALAAYAADLERLRGSLHAGRFDFRWPAA